MMNMLKRTKLVCGTALLAIALGLSACSGGGTPAATNAPVSDTSSNEGTAAQPAEESKEPVTVTFWNGWTGPDGELMRQLVDQYNEKNTDNVTIAMDIMEFASLNEKLATSLASNTNPNLHLGFATGEYAVEGQYIPIDDIFEKTNLQKSDFDPGLLENCYYKGNLYGIPFQVTSQYLFYNKELYRQAGLDPESPPTTWEMLLEYSKKIDALGNGINGGGFSFNDGLLLGAAMVSYGGMAIVDDDQGIRSALTDPQYIEGNRKALQLFYDYAHQSEWNMMNDNYEAAYQAGTAAMIITGSWQLAGAKDYGIDYGISLLPSGSSRIAQPGYPISICVMKNTEGRALQGAFDFINYWSNNIDNPVVDESPAFAWTQKQGYQAYLLSTADLHRTRITI